MQESDTYPAIVDEGQKKARPEVILVPWEDCLEPPGESNKAEQNNYQDLGRLIRIVCKTPNAATWKEILRVLFRPIAPDDATCHRWVDEAYLECARKWVLILGEDSLGSSSGSVKDRVNSITDPDRLERMARAAEKATSWQEILDTP
jgi:hypothetical protein